jgi:hypothetical protein
MSGSPGYVVFFVMAGQKRERVFAQDAPAIHVFRAVLFKDVDVRHKARAPPPHRRGPYSISATNWCWKDCRNS